MENLIHGLLEAIGEDPKRDSLKDTPARVAESMKFLTSGYEKDVREILNSAVYDEDFDEMVIVRDIDIFSLCEHHMLPFFGRCHVAYIPDKCIVGLSKIPRLVDAYARRLQVQERLTTQIANTFNELVKPFGVGVVIEAQHLCMMMRGVEKQNAVATTSAMLGQFQTNPKTRAEFLQMINRGNV